MRTRLLVVARSFWPLCDEASLRLGEWSVMLQNLGAEVTILTGRWHASWPGESDCREVKVVRLLPAPKSGWSETLFLRNIASWITKHRQEYDAIYVDEANALLHQISAKHVHADLPVWARFPGVFQDVPFSVSLGAISQACDGCRKATRVIVPNPDAQRQLVASGIASDRTEWIRDVAWYPVQRDPHRRAEILRSLRNINSDMSLPKDVKLLTYVGPFTNDPPLLALLEGLVQLVEHHTKLRVWMIGSGRSLPELHDFVKYAGVHHDILFQSPFDDLESILQVSDGIVCPSAHYGFEYIMPHAHAAGIPFLTVTHSPYRHSMNESLQHGLLPVSNLESYRRHLEDWYQNLSTWQIKAEKGRQEFIANGWLEQSRNQWQRLLASIATPSS